MSSDVDFHGFHQGAATAAGGDVVRAVLDPWVVHRADELSFLQVEVGDGTADVYLDEDDMLVNHVTGEDPWDLLVRSARAAGWVVLPVDGPACLTAESQRVDLPVELVAGAVVVASGPELLAAILDQDPS